jgi:hypothetical protein
VVLVHFRDELRARIDAACAARPGAQAGRPGLRIEVGHESAAVGASDPHAPDLSAQARLT